MYVQRQRPFRPGVSQHRTDHPHPCGKGGGVYHPGSLYRQCGQHRRSGPDAGVAHPVERHLAKVEVASSSLVTRSKKVRNVTTRSLFHMVPWPSGKARVCKTLIRQFKSGRYLQKSAIFFRRLPIFTYYFFTIHSSLITMGRFLGSKK